MQRSSGKNLSKIIPKKTDNSFPPNYNPFDKKWEIKKDGQIIFSSSDKEVAMQEWDRLQKMGKNKGSR